MEHHQGEKTLYLGKKSLMSSKKKGQQGKRGGTLLRLAHSYWASKYKGGTKISGVKGDSEGRFPES